MWVESQNKKWLVNLTNVKKLEVAVKHAHRKNDAQDSAADGYAVRTEDTLLGVYPTEEAAKRALKYLKDEIAEHGRSGEYLCRMPKGMETEAKHETV